MPNSLKCLDPDRIIPFDGYLNRDGRRDVCFSLAHFYESEKYRGTSEDLRQEVLAASTGRKARKISRAHITQWREDWKSMKPYVLGAGMRMQSTQVGAVADAMSFTAQHALELSGIKATLGGIPVAFLANVAKHFHQESLDRTATRLAVLALQQFTPVDIRSRLDALYPVPRPAYVTVYVGDDANQGVARWCADNAIATEYVGATSNRFLDEEHSARLLESATHLLVCASSSRRDVALFRDRLKGRKLKVTILNRAVDGSATEVTLNTGVTTRRGRAPAARK